jgi:hypothetical protein
MPKSLSLLSLLLLAAPAFAQPLKTLAQLPSFLTESSGIEVSGANKIWTFNDGGGANALYLVDTSGALLKTLTISGAWNRDWEDIAQDDQGNVYIANVGNNTNDNTDLTIFKIPNPDLVSGNSVAAEVITFAYEDQWSFPPPDDSLHFDCEAIWWHDDHLYLCTKNRTDPFDGIAYVYRIPDAPGQYLAEKTGAFDTGGATMLNYWITAGDVSPDGAKLCLLSSDKMWIFYDFTGDDYFGGQFMQIGFPNFSQKEAVCFVTNDKLYITDEETFPGFGRNLYSIDLSDTLTHTAELPLRPPGLSLFPNPGSDWLIVEGQLSGYQLSIFDAKGERLRFVPALTSPAKIRIGDLPDGLLFVELRDKVSGERWVEKVVKE